MEASQSSVLSELSKAAESSAAILVLAKKICELSGLKPNSKNLALAMQTLMLTFTWNKNNDNSQTIC